MASSNDRKNGGKTARNADGTFGPGNPGKPKGSRHKTTLAIQELLEGEAEALTRTAIERALDGDTTALRLCLERLAPPCKDRHVTVPLPDDGSALKPVEAMEAILQAVASGEITPEEGLSVARLVEVQRRVIEAAQFEARLLELEELARSRGDH